MQHVNVKIFSVPAEGFDIHAAIPVFHRWIQTNVCSELLIDVVDYTHVPAGPGVMLIGHEADYSLDNARNRLGLLYNAKSPNINLQSAYEAARAAVERLESEPEFAGKLKFNSAEVEITLNDRLLYPNDDETWRSLQSDFEAFFDGLFGAGNYTVARDAGPLERFRAQAVKTH
jgi:hypothetical protein